ncbi:DUF6124 family protein [Pseudomonas poae]|uniref:Uncharacterized protein n=1 Tax=Pseudomonas poae TaxID=200451 RepID=A0A2S9E643_9PSED|nr:hypothetical protein CQZ97_25915 [Pseudomonas poae]PRC10248.1 hypothetical protein CQZ99_27295 [Pseudomonas poae]
MAVCQSTHVSADPLLSGASPLPQVNSVGSENSHKAFRLLLGTSLANPFTLHPDLNTETLLTDASQDLASLNDIAAPPTFESPGSVIPGSAPNCSALLNIEKTPLHRA